MDEIDRKILRLLQIDNSLSVADIARKVGLSASPCWKRISRLNSQGVIKRKIAVLDSEIMGLSVTAYVSIRTGEHSKEWLEQFSNRVTEMPEVMEFHRMAGDVDYMLKVVVPDIQAFDDKPKARCPECKKLTRERKDFYSFSHQWSHDARNDHLFP